MMVEVVAFVLVYLVTGSHAAGTIYIVCTRIVRITLFFNSYSQAVCRFYCVCFAAIYLVRVYLYMCDRYWSAVVVAKLGTRNHPDHATLQ